MTLREFNEATAGLDPDTVLWVGNLTLGGDFEQEYDLRLLPDSDNNELGIGNE